VRQKPTRRMNDAMEDLTTWQWKSNVPRPTRETGRDALVDRFRFGIDRGRTDFDVCQRTYQPAGGAVK